MTLDELITEFDRGLRSIVGVSRMSRPIPRPEPFDVAARTGEEMTLSSMPLAKRRITSRGPPRACANSIRARVC